MRRFVYWWCVFDFLCYLFFFFFFFSSRRRHTRWTGDWSSDVCSSDLSAVDSSIIELSTALGLRVVAEGVETRDAWDRLRSEERRVGKECRSRWSPDH